MLALSKLDLDEIANALADQTDYEHRWLIDPETGQIHYWTSDGGTDGETPVDLDELDVVLIDPEPSYVWYRDMVDFVEGISDERAGRSMGRAIQGRGAFRRFKDCLHEDFPDLAPIWYAFSDVRAKRRAVEWLIDNSLVDDERPGAFWPTSRIPTCPERRLCLRRQRG